MVVALRVRALERTPLVVQAQETPKLDLRVESRPAAQRAHAERVLETEQVVVAVDAEREAARRHARPHRSRLRELNDLAGGVLPSTVLREQPLASESARRKQTNAFLPMSSESSRYDKQNVQISRSGQTACESRLAKPSNGVDYRSRSQIRPAMH